MLANSAAARSCVAAVPRAAVVILITHTRATPSKNSKGALPSHSRPHRVCTCRFTYSQDKTDSLSLRANALAPEVAAGHGVVIIIPYSLPSTELHAILRLYNAKFIPVHNIVTCAAAFAAHLNASMNYQGVLLILEVQDEYTIVNAVQVQDGGNSLNVTTLLPRLTSMGYLRDRAWYSNVVVHVATKIAAAPTIDIMIAGESVDDACVKTVVEACTNNTRVGRIFSFNSTVAGDGNKVIPEMGCMDMCSLGKLLYSNILDKSNMRYIVLVATYGDIPHIIQRANDISSGPNVAYFEATLPAGFYSALQLVDSSGGVIREAKHICVATDVTITVKVETVATTVRIFMDNMALVWESNDVIKLEDGQMPLSTAVLAAKSMFDEILGSEEFIGWFIGLTTRLSHGDADARTILDVVNTDTVYRLLQDMEAVAFCMDSSADSSTGGIVDMQGGVHSSSADCNVQAMSNGSQALQRIATVLMHHIDNLKMKANLWHTFVILAYMD